MSEYVPDPWPFVLLSLAAWRVWKLIGDDSILDRPRDWAVDQLGPKLDELITCVYCSGFYISVAWWLAWLAFPTETLIAAVPWAISAVVGLLGSTWGAIADE